MKPAPSTEIRAVPRVHRAKGRGQRGDALFEALIALVLMGAIGLGLGYASSRVIQTTRDTSVQNLVVAAVHDQLQENSTGMTNVCGTTFSITPVTGKASVTVAASCTSSSTVSVVPTGNSALRVDSLTSPMTSLTLTTTTDPDSVISPGSIVIGDSQ